MVFMDYKEMFHWIFVMEKDETSQFCTHPSTHVCVWRPAMICPSDLHMYRILKENPSTHPLLTSELSLWVQERWAKSWTIDSVTSPSTPVSGCDRSPLYCCELFPQVMSEGIICFSLPDLFNLMSPELAYDATKERISFFCSVYKYATVFTIQLYFLRSSVGETKMVLDLTCCEHVWNMAV